MSNVLAQLFVVFDCFKEQKLLRVNIWYCFHPFDDHVPCVDETLKIARLYLNALQIQEVVQCVWGSACCKILNDNSQQ